MAQLAQHRNIRASRNKPNLTYKSLNKWFLENSYTVCPGSSDPTLNIESNYFIQLNSFDLKSFCSVNELYST